MRERKKRELFEERIEPCYNKVYYFLLGKTEDHELAQDLTQNAFEKAWHKLDQLQNSQSALSWILSIAKNEMNLYFRAQNAEKRALFVETSYEDMDVDVELGDLENDVLDTILLNESKEDAIKALYQVKEEYFEVLRLRMIEDLSYKEIAEVLNMKEATARTRYRRGLDCLKEEYVKVTGGENCE